MFLQDYIPVYSERGLSAYVGPYDENPGSSGVSAVPSVKGFDVLYIRTGRAFNMLALEVDARACGQLASLLRDGSLEGIPRTPSVTAPDGRSTYLYSCRSITCEGIGHSLELTPGIIMRSDGGKVMIPPSCDHLGRPAVWHDEFWPRAGFPAAMVRILATLLMAEKEKASSSIELMRSWEGKEAGRLFPAKPGRALWVKLALQALN
ncbi:MAG: bifunctional DNA primase/polymerase [Candidatus Eremiobacteraeota bacterium]|nr:bifunctional DNA primase/polymerase [Candidatus Eremiobacteraeota bacterium]